MPSSHTLPDDPVYAFCPSYDLDNVPQQIRIVFDNMPGYVPTALFALSLDDALRICNRLKRPPRARLRCLVRNRRPRHVRRPR